MLVIYYIYETINFILLISITEILFEKNKLDSTVKLAALRSSVETREQPSATMKL
jgi:hypothetical protein